MIYTPATPICYYQPMYLYNIVNEYRVENKKNPLSQSDILCGLAATRTEETYTDWSHDGFKRHDKGYFVYFSFLGENLAKGFYDDYDSMLERWKESPSHNENLLDKRYTHQCAVCVNAYCTHIFGGQKEVVDN